MQETLTTGLFREQQLTKGARAISVLLAAVLVTGCSSAPSGLSPAVKRIEARQSAFDRAHPGVVHCEVTVMILLSDTVNAMQQGYSSGIDPNQVMAKFGAYSAVYLTFINVDGQVIAYVDEHGQVGSVASVRGMVRTDCQHYLAVSSSSPASAPLAQPTSPAAEQPGFAGALSVWKQTQNVWRGYCRSFLLRAAADLRAAGESQYAPAIGRLANLASIPIRGLTPAQNNEGYADVEALNRFFGTPGLITC